MYVSVCACVCEYVCIYRQSLTCVINIYHYVRLKTHMYVYVRVCVHVYKCMCVCICMRVHICTCMSMASLKRAYLRIYVYVWTSIYMGARVCVRVCARVRAWIHTSKTTCQTPETNQRRSRSSIMSQQQNRTERPTTKAEKPGHVPPAPGLQKAISVKDKGHWSDSGRDYLVQDTQRLLGEIFCLCQKMAVSSVHIHRRYDESIPRECFRHNVSRWPLDGHTGWLLGGHPVWPLDGHTGSERPHHSVLPKGNLITDSVRSCSVNMCIYVCK